MAELFKAYEQDFLKALSAANKKSAMIGKAPNRQAVIEDANYNIIEAEKALKLMEKEMMSIPSNQAS
jgi:hypothetical protein